MRNYHHVSNTPFVTYSVNGDEYSKDFDQIRQDVIQAIAAAMDARLLDVINELNSLVSQGPLEENEYEIKFVTPSEGRVLAAFVLFSIDIQIWEQANHSRSCAPTSRVFSYHSLNTGKSVIWMHMVS